MKIDVPQIPQNGIDITLPSGSDIRPRLLLAIEDLAAKGGGRIVIHPGSYRCNGPIPLKSRIELHLSEGCFIRFAPEPELYLPPVETRWEGVELWNFSPAVYGADLTDVAITGKGVLAGGSEVWRTWRARQNPAQERVRCAELEHIPVEKRIFGPDDFLRPAMIQLIRSKRLLFEDFTLTDASFWMLHPVYCSEITIRGLVFDSMFLNNDGIDVDSCENVLIEDSVFRNGDDAVVIKSGRDADGLRVGCPTRNVTVRNCVFEDVLHGFAIGSELSGGAENINLSGITMKKVRGEAICFKSAQGRGGIIQNISLENILVEKAGGNLISIHSDYSNVTYGEKLTLFRNIRLKDIRCQWVKNAFIFHGRRELPLGTVNLENVIIEKADTLYGQDEYSDQVHFSNVCVNGKELHHP